MCNQFSRSESVAAEEHNICLSIWFLGTGHATNQAKLLS